MVDLQRVRSRAMLEASINVVPSCLRSLRGAPRGLNHPSAFGLKVSLVTPSKSVLLLRQGQSCYSVKVSLVTPSRSVLLLRQGQYCYSVKVSLVTPSRSVLLLRQGQSCSPSRSILFSRAYCSPVYTAQP